MEANKYGRMCICSFIMYSRAVSDLLNLISSSVESPSSNSTTPESNLGGKAESVQQQQLKDIGVEGKPVGVMTAQLTQVERRQPHHHRAQRLVAASACEVNTFLQANHRRCGVSLRHLV